MTEADENIFRISRTLLERYGLRVQRPVAQYVLDQLKNRSAGQIPVMAGDARSGVPVRRMIDTAELLQILNQPQQSNSP